jgi:hypothetical protein
VKRVCWRNGWVWVWGSFQSIFVCLGNLWDLRQQGRGKTHKSDDEDPKWQAQSRTFRAKYEMGADDCPWTGLPTTKLHGVPAGKRHRDLLDIAYKAATRGLTDPFDIEHAKSNLIVDLSQGLTRTPWHDGFPTFTTSSLLYSFDQDRVVPEKCKFRMLGFGELSDGDLSDHALRDLSGEAMAVPVVTLVLSAVIVSVNFPGLFA